MVSHLAMVTTETLPPFLHPCAGGGVRVWGVGEALRRRGVFGTYFLREGTPGMNPLPDNIPIRVYRPELLAEEIQQAGCDAVLFEQWQPLTFLQEPLDIPVFVDLPGPLVLEYVWRDAENLYQHIVDKVSRLAYADYFLCAHERQRGYYDAWLTWAGVEPDAGRITVTPFVFHEMPVSRQGHVEDEPLFFWGGMFWPWQDRTKAFDTILQTLQRYQRGQMVIVGVCGNDETAGGLDRRYTEHSHISYYGALPFTDYVTELKRASVAVDLCRPTEERRLSSDLRTGTALWAGTPCLVSPDSPWAAWIAEHEAGWVIDYEDTKVLAELIRDIALERVDIVARRRGAKAISEKISNDANVESLLKWLSNPTKRKPSPSFFDARSEDREKRLREMQFEVDRLRFEKECLQHDLDSIRANPLFKLYKRLCFWR